MNINKTPKGTKFRLFRETFIVTSEPFYCRLRGIMMVKAHNVTTGVEEEIGEVVMNGAHPITQEKSMDIHLTAREFISEFAHEDDAIDYIISCKRKNLVYVSQNVLPAYSLRNGQLVSFPEDWHPNTHSFEVRIERYYEDGDSCADAVVTFRFGEEMDLFHNCLSIELDGKTEKSEMYSQDGFNNSVLREVKALGLQVALNQSRIQRTRRYLATHGLNLHPAEFDANCKTIANLNDFNDRAFDRIGELGY